MYGMANTYMTPPLSREKAFLIGNKNKKVLHRTAITVRSIAAGELGR